MSMAQTDMIRGDIAEVMAQAEYNGGGIDTIKNNALLNAGSVVKSVQRGYVDSKNISANASMSIPISTVDADKSILLFYVGQTTYPNVEYSLTDNAIVLTSHVGYVVSVSGFSWQVIEFY